jgi:hypothetical protein
VNIKDVESATGDLNTLESLVKSKNSNDAISKDDAELKAIIVQIQGKKNELKEIQRQQMNMEQQICMKMFS